MPADTTAADSQAPVIAVGGGFGGLSTALSLAAAGYTIHLLASSHHFGSGYQLVQVCLALGLLAGVIALWPRLRRFELVG